MAARLIGAWNPALDSSGKPVSGSKLNTYVAGTTTNQATYTSPALTTPQTNPVVADSAGRFPELWTPDGSTYDLKWTDASGTQIELFQSIQALGAGTTGAVTRDFGADGRFNLEGRGGVFEIEAGDASPDNLGGITRIGGWNGSQGDTLTLDYRTVQITGAFAGIVQRGAIGGLTFSTAGSSATFSVSKGQATDSTGAVSLVLPSAFTKTTASWAVGSGNGALDTGAIAANTWYHAYLIQRVDSGLVDIIVSLSATAPALPANYTLYRRVWSLLTDSAGSPKWVKFVQKGETCLWDAAAGDVNAFALTATGAKKALSSPLGVSCEAIFNVDFVDTSSSANRLTVHSPLQADQTNNTPPGNVTFYVVANGPGAVAMRAFTDTSSQIRFIPLGNGTLYVVTNGYVDRRGRDD